MRAVFNKTLLKLAKNDPRIHMVLADIGYGEIEPFRDTFPDVNVSLIGHQKWLREQYGMSADSIAARVKETLKK